MRLINNVFKFHEIMKRLFFILICFALLLPVMAQNAKAIDKAVQREMKIAERYIPDFHRKDVTKYYSACCLFVQKKYRELKFDSVPSYEQIEQYLDFSHTPVDEVLAKTDRLTWRLMGKYTNHNSYCYGKAESISLYEYLESVKADRAYYLFGQSELFILVEKDGVRYPVRLLDGKYIRCQLSDLIDDVGDLNVFYFHAHHHFLPLYCR